MLPGMACAHSTSTVDSTPRRARMPRCVTTGRSCPPSHVRLAPQLGRAPLGTLRAWRSGSTCTCPSAATGATTAAFATWTDRTDLAERYLAACRRQITEAAPQLPPVTSVFVGGGTPSLVAPDAPCSTCWPPCRWLPTPRSRSVQPRRPRPGPGGGLRRGGGTPACRSACSRTGARGAAHPRAASTIPTTSARRRRRLAPRACPSDVGPAARGRRRDAGPVGHHARRGRRAGPGPRERLRPHRRGGHAAGGRSRPPPPTTTRRPTSTCSPPTASAPPGSSGTRSPTGRGRATSAATTSCTGPAASTSPWGAQPTGTATAVGTGTSAPPSATWRRWRRGARRRRGPRSWAPTSGGWKGCSSPSGTRQGVAGSDVAPTTS